MLVPDARFEPIRQISSYARSREAGPALADRYGLQLRLALERTLVLEAVIAGETRHERASRPFFENAADVLARDAGHGGEIALRDLLAHQNAAPADIVAEAFRQAQ